MSANNCDIEGSTSLELAILIRYHISLSSTQIESVHHRWCFPMRNGTWCTVTMLPKIWAPTMLTFYDSDPLTFQHRFRWVSSDSIVVSCTWNAWKIFAQNWNSCRWNMAIWPKWWRSRSRIPSVVYSKCKRTIVSNIGQCSCWQQSVQNYKWPTRTTIKWFYRWT